MEQNRFHARHNGSAADLKPALSFFGGLLLGMLAIRRKSRKTVFRTKSSTHTPLKPAPVPPISQPQAVAAAPQKAHQPSEVSFPLLITAGVLTIVFALAIHLALWWWLQALRGPAAVEETTRWKVTQQPSGTATAEYPQLQVAPRQDLQRFLAHQRQELQQLDQKSGIVRIPIEAAMHLVAEQGVPQWKPANQQAGSVSALELQGGRVPKKQEDAK